MKTISEHILDIVQNSVRAKATLIEIIVAEDKKNDFYSLVIKDNGCGMNSEIVKKATNPFFTSRSTRKVGLGLSLLKQNAERANGYFQINSEEKKGTTVKAVFQLSNVDRPPLGDIWETWYLTLISHENLELVYRHKTENGEFILNSEEIKDMLGDVSLKQKEIREAVLELFKNNLIEIDSTI
jgi:anti-sigma regulatory factor (Ser/Thr protein kinase)